MTTETAYHRLHARCKDCGGCLLWQGSTNGSGHPRIKGGSARRAVWEDLRGPIPQHQVISLSCGQSLCLAVEHMQLCSRATVSARSNARPHVRLKRAVTSARTNRPSMGKITMELARQIRASTLTGKEWAERLGVTTSLISKVRQHKSWVEHVNPFAGLMK